MAVGKEIKRLRGKKTSAADAANLIGVSVDRLRKWEERDSDPSDTGDIKKVEDYFGVSLNEIKSIKSFDFVEFPRGKALESKHIELLERENKRLQRDLDISLGELRHNSLLARAVSETNQELLVELIAGLRKQKYETVALQVRTANGEKYQRMKEEGKFADVGK